MLWKKRMSPEQQVAEDTDKILAALTSKWVMFNQALAFKDGVTLADKMEMFATPAFAGILTNYPTTKHAPASMLWLMLFNAVIDSKTHPVDEVNAAVAMLEEKYAG